MWRASESSMSSQGGRFIPCCISFTPWSLRSGTRYRLGEWLLLTAVRGQRPHGAVVDETVTMSSDQQSITV